VSLASTFNAGRARTPGPGQASQTRPEPEQQKKVALAHFGPARSFEPSSCGSGTAPLALSTATATTTATAARATRDSSHHQQPAQRTRHDWATPRVRPCTSRHWNPLPCTTVERRLVEAGNFPDNGGEDIVAWKWKLGPNLVMADQRPSSTACPTVAAHHSLPLAIVLEPASAQVYESSSAIGPQVPRRGAGEQGNHLQRMTMHRRGVVGPRERTPRTEPRIALGLVSDMPPSTELRKEGVLRSDSKCRQNSIQAWRCIATTKPQLLALSGTIQDP
jgi:hypothetical protein